MVSSISGVTSTAANDVCRRALASNGLIRTSRCTLVLLGQLGGGAQLLGVAGEGLVGLQDDVELLLLGDDLLGLLLAVPEAGGAHLRRQLVELFLLGRDVKGSPAAG